MRYLPKKGEKVRLVSACHPKIKGKVLEISKVYQDEKGIWWFESEDQKETITGLVLGVTPA